MHHAQGKTTASFLIRLRSQDTPTGISAGTLDELVKVTGMSKTEIAHLALRNFADRYLPHYEKDDGPLSNEQICAIREASAASDIADDNFTQRLF
ncbi:MULTISPECIES: hypothetical protein [Photorhabdus]|uniref:Uncharacterized protein n=1 Tax=Photorhabdus luminescens subsp. sonorensis TaxID=1173677 RepID=A0A5C4RFZ9_PHOLU|nr:MULTISPECIES: hypothetical protein [Photorhabdus]MCW7549949.1 hypothetical protein [Photorhabdus aballayi]MCW7763281.1 hypothetical protein [Photorhabdus luminescens subsp. venezuelensis]OWO82690.1 hypothetical protein B5C26_09980 [Photorhabdus luminescens]TNH43013.1 hypothetical protein EP164_13745 [Photorhabdus luminescens subsp. sonorensis]